MSATFRGIGIVTGPTVVLTLTILLDAAFAAVLIPGLGFIPALGVKGAGVAGTLSLAIGLILMLAYCRRTEPDIAIQRKPLAPQLSVWRRISSVGLPAAAELTLMFLMMSVVYTLSFGTRARLLRQVSGSASVFFPCWCWRVSPSH